MGDRLSMADTMTFGYQSDFYINGDLLDFFKVYYCLPCKKSIADRETNWTISIVVSLRIIMASLTYLT